MLHSKKSELLIGFTISVLLSLFVNFPMLMRNYDYIVKTQGDKSQATPPLFFDNYFFYFLLAWFFIFAFILFIVNMQMYRIGDKLLKLKEYKVVLFAGVISVIVGIGLLVVFPFVQNTVQELIIQDTTKVDKSSSDKIISGYGRPVSKAKRTYEEVKSAHPIAPPFFFHPQFTEHLFVLLTIILSVLQIRLSCFGRCLS